MCFRKIIDEVPMDISMDDPVQMLKEENEKLRAELAIAREALKFYEHAYADIGKVARAALSGAEPKSRGELSHDFKIEEQVRQARIDKIKKLLRLT